MKDRLSTHTKGEKNPIILRDHLAAHRTALANDRTFLAYVRTALAFAAVGVTFIRFFGNPVIKITGWLSILVGIYIVITGYLQFTKTKKAIKEEELNPPDVSDI